MADWSQFDETTNKTRPVECAVCEAMCPDAVDGTLSEAERQVFDRHVAGCASCSRELEEAQRGAAWLGMLKGHTPEPPAALLAKILAETTGAEAASVSQPVRASQPALVPTQPATPTWALSSILRKMAGPFRVESTRATFQPRLAMTAAMAFVSIALTLNLTGVRLKNLHASSFTPSALRRSVTDASATAARSFENMRVVYQVESRVSELRGEGPLANQTNRQTPFLEAQPQPQQPNGAATDNGTDSGTDSGIVRRPRHKGL